MAGELDLLIIVGIILLVPIAFIIGKWTDLNWRCRAMRKLLKKDYVLLTILGHDYKTMKQKIVNPDGAVVAVGSSIWVFNNRFIWRRVNLGGKWVDQKEKGFQIREENIRFDEGAPVLFVSNDSLLPISFSGEKEKVPPGELGSWVLAFYENMKAQAANELKQHHLFTLIILGGILLLGLGVYVVYQEVQTVHAEIKTVEGNAQIAAQGGVLPPVPPGTFNFSRVG